MRLFWMVVRYNDNWVQPHPQIGIRGTTYLMNPNGGRSELPPPMFTSRALAEQYAVTLAQQNPSDSIIVMGQACVFELPELPAPIKKHFNSAGELIPDAR